MKNFKIIGLIITVFLLQTNCILAQNGDKVSTKNEIEITPYIAESTDGIPEEAQRILTNKMGEILTQNGVIKGINSNFILTANTTVLTKEITPTAPPMFVFVFQITYFIGNGIDGNVFSSQSATIKGVGINETKAYIDAFKGISTKNNDLTELISKAKAKIVAYYNSKCNAILSEATTLEKTGRYNEALYKLTAIPDACSDCYSKALNKMESVYKKAIDMDCNKKMSDANNIWNANPNENGANQVADILKTINPNSNCFSNAKILGQKIEKKLNEVDQREFKLFYEQQVGLEKDRIEAMKEIGKAYGNGQAKNVTYNTKYWW
jgi:hypothetical protein